MNSSNTRPAILAADGRLVAIASADQAEAAATALQTAGIAAWLVDLTGNPHRRCKLAMVRQISAGGDYAAAEAAFYAAR